MTEPVPTLPENLDFPPLMAIPTPPPLHVLVTWTADQIDAWWSRAGEVEEINQAILRQHRAAKKTWAVILEARGQKVQAKRGMATLAQFDHWVEMLGYKPRAVCSRKDRLYSVSWKDGKWFRLVDLGNTLAECLTEYRRRATIQENLAALATTREQKLLALSASLNVNPANFQTTAAFLTAVEDAAKSAHMAREFPEGTEVAFDGCECGQWTVGNCRCSCGNRRVSLEIDGDVVTGFYAYPVAC